MDEAKGQGESRPLMPGLADQGGAAAQASSGVGEDWIEGRRQRGEGDPNFSGRKSKPSRKEIQDFSEGNPNSILPFPLPNRAFSRTYADPAAFSV
jgi:hypothetical protein